MELIIPEIAMVLSAVTKKQKEKQKEKLFEGTDSNIQNSSAQHSRQRRVAFQDEECRTPDVDMDSDGDLRNPGTAYEIQEPQSPLPVVGFPYH